MNKPSGVPLLLFAVAVIVGWPAAAYIGSAIGFERGWVQARCEYTRDAVHTASDSVRYLKSGCPL